MFTKSILSLKSSSSLGDDFVAAMHESQNGCELRWLMGPFAKVVPQRSFYRSVQRVHEFMDRRIYEAQQSRKLLTPKPDPGMEQQDRRLFLHALERVTNNQNLLRDELLTFFLAGVDTTAALLTNLFFVLAKRPDIWRRLRHEVNPLHGKTPTIEELRSLKYHQFSLKECKLDSFANIQRSSLSAASNSYLVYEC